MMLGRLRRPPAPTAAPGETAEALVQLAYRTVLRREPDESGAASYAADLRGGKDLAWLLSVLSGSDEFAALASQAAALTEPAHLLSQDPPMPVELHCDPAASQALWDYVARTWSRLGEDDPHWSVLTNEAFRADVLDAAALDAFYASGDSEVARLEAWLRRGGLSLRPDAVCAEYGCGVGRVTGSLARRVKEVLAFDVSAPHLRLAAARMAAGGVGNVRFVPVTGRPTLAMLRDLDMFYSVIVLQHSPPPIIVDVLEHAFAALRPGGFAFFQVPTFCRGYGYSTAAHLAETAAGRNVRGEVAGAMEVHFVPQAEVFALAHRAGLVPVEVLPDVSIGDLDRAISNTFLFRRP